MPSLAAILISSIIKHFHCIHTLGSYNGRSSISLCCRVQEYSFERQTTLQLEAGLLAWCLPLPSSSWFSSLFALSNATVAGSMLFMSERQLMAAQTLMRNKDFQSLHSRKSSYQPAITLLAWYSGLSDKIHHFSSMWKCLSYEFYLSSILSFVKSACVTR